MLTREIANSVPPFGTRPLVELAGVPETATNGEVFVALGIEPHALEDVTEHFWDLLQERALRDGARGAIGVLLNAIATGVLIGREEAKR